MPIRLKQFSRFPNIGDRISALVVQHVTGKAVEVMGPEPVQRPNLVGVGSILHWADAHSLLWSCGSIDPKLPFSIPKKVLAVRGRLTRDLLTSQGVPCSDVLGDGSAFVCEMYPANPKPQWVGFVPHYRDRESGFTERCRSEGFKILDVTSEPDVFIDELTSCEAIVSSSLHGIIIAHSYCIPAVWVAISQMHAAGLSTDFKFFDYYSSVGMFEPEIRPALHTQSIAAILKGLSLPAISIDKAPLREVLVDVVSELDE